MEIQVVGDNKEEIGNKKGDNVDGDEESEEECTESNKECAESKEECMESKEKHVHVKKRKERAHVESEERTHERAERVKVDGKKFDKEECTKSKEKQAHVETARAEHVSAERWGEKEGAEKEDVIDGKKVDVRLEEIGNKEVIEVRDIDSDEENKEESTEIEKEHVHVRKIGEHVHAEIDKKEEGAKRLEALVSKKADSRVENEKEDIQFEDVDGGEESKEEYTESFAEREKKEKGAEKGEVDSKKVEIRGNEKERLLRDIGNKKGDSEIEDINDDEESKKERVHEENKEEHFLAESEEKLEDGEVERGKVLEGKKVDIRGLTRQEKQRLLLDIDCGGGFGSVDFHRLRGSYPAVYNASSTKRRQFRNCLFYWKKLNGSGKFEEVRNSLTPLFSSSAAAPAASLTPPQKRTAPAARQPREMKQTPDIPDTEKARSDNEDLDRGLSMQEKQRLLWDIDAGGGFGCVNLSRLIGSNPALYNASSAKKKQFSNCLFYWKKMHNGGKFQEVRDSLKAFSSLSTPKRSTRNENENVYHGLSMQEKQRLLRDIDAGGGFGCVDLRILVGSFPTVYNASSAKKKQFSNCLFYWKRMHNGGKFQEVRDSLKPLFSARRTGQAATQPSRKRKQAPHTPDTTETRNDNEDVDHGLTLQEKQVLLRDIDAGGGLGCVNLNRLIGSNPALYNATSVKKRQFSNCLSYWKKMHSFGKFDGVRDALKPNLSSCSATQRSNATEQPNSKMRKQTPSPDDGTDTENTGDDNEDDVVEIAQDVDVAEIVAEAAAAGGDPTVYNASTQAQQPINNHNNNNKKQQQQQAPAATTTKSPQQQSNNNQQQQLPLVVTTTATTPLEFSKKQKTATSSPATTQTTTPLELSKKQKTATSSPATTQTTTTKRTLCINRPSSSFIIDGLNFRIV